MKTDRDQNPGGSGEPPVSSVLFVCGMNAIRSPMAEAIAKSLLPRGTYVVSAGVRTGNRDPFVDAVLTERQLSLGDRRPQGFADLADSYFDLIVTMAPEAHHTVLHKGDFRDAIFIRYGWPVPFLSPTCCCGAPFSLQHSLDCLIGGYRTLQHNEVRDWLPTASKKLVLLALRPNQHSK